MSELPKYKCQKVVRAARISWFGRLDQTYELHLDVNGEDVVRPVPAWWFETNRPEAGGYFVEADHAVGVYLPAAAFEREYARVPSFDDGYAKTLPPTPATATKPSKRKGEV